MSTSEYIEPVEMSFDSIAQAFRVLDQTSICVLSSGSLEIHCGTCRYCLGAQPAIRYLREQFAELRKGDPPSNSAERALEGYEGAFETASIEEVLDSIRREKENRDDG